MKLQTLLENLLEEDIDEVAVSVAQAKAENLAVYFDNPDGWGRTIILYKPQEVLAGLNSMVRLRSAKENKKPISINSIRNVITKINGIVGMISFSINGKSKIGDIISSCANKGYGPLMYDLALSNAYPGFLAPDNHSVSEEAQRVWSYYFNKRPDVEKQFQAEACSDLSCGHSAAKNVEGDINIETLQDKKFEFDEQIRAGNLRQDEIAKLNKKIALLDTKINELARKHPLAYMYRITKPRSSVSLANAHRQLLVSVNKTGTEEDKFESALLKAGNDFFSRTII